jgi:hypothetical protein
MFFRNQLEAESREKPWRVTLHFARTAQLHPGFGVHKIKQFKNNDTLGLHNNVPISLVYNFSK